jgi:hypothetical protein
MAEKTKKNPRGAGRKPLPEHLKKRNCGVSIPPVKTEKWRKRAKREAVPMSEMLEGWIDGNASYYNHKKEI